MSAFHVSSTELLARSSAHFPLPYPNRFPMKCPLAWSSVAFPCSLHRVLRRTYFRAFSYGVYPCIFIPLSFIYPCWVSYTSAFSCVSRWIPLYLTPWVVPWLPGGLSVLHGIRSIFALTYLSVPMLLPCILVFDARAFYCGPRLVSCYKLMTVQPGGFNCPTKHGR